MHYKILSAESVENRREKQHALYVYLSNQHREAGRGRHPAGVGVRIPTQSGVEAWWLSNIIVLYYYIHTSRPQKRKFKNLVQIKSSLDVKTVTIHPPCITHILYCIRLALLVLYTRTKLLHFNTNLSSKQEAGKQLFAPSDSCKYTASL